MIEARPSRDGSRTTLFTKDHFREMIKLEEFIMNLQAPQELVDKITPESVSFYDLCRKKNITDEIVQNFADEACLTDEYFCLEHIEEKCQASPKPLDFIYDRKSDSYDLDQFESDLDLIGRI